MAKDKVKPKLKPKSADKPKDELQEQSKIWQDERFQHLVTDPRFKNLPKAQRKVKIDKRFQSMFTDQKFKVKYTVDKYGRRVNKSNADDLRKYYELDEHTDSDDDEEEEAAAAVEDDSKEDDNEETEADEAEEQRKEERAISRDARQEELDEAATASDAESGVNDELNSEGEVSNAVKSRLFDPEVDYARGEGRLITDSSSDDESSEDEEVDMLKVDHVWGEFDVNAETTDNSTNRLALLNMDWDRIRAVDIMMLLSSFLPPGGSIVSVKIYPSEFGKERLAEEEVNGPQELVGLGKNTSNKQNAKKRNAAAASSDEDEELVQAQDSDAEEGDDYHMEKLRQYQLNRLRYYYAVVECDTVQTADKIYKECDGLEYESSATRVDLRFIPDDTSFDEDEPKDVCSDLPDSSAYKPRQFTTTALQQAKVDLTWDETAVERRELGDKLATGKLDDVSDKDLRTIVAYSSEEDSEAGSGSEEAEGEVKVDNEKPPANDDETNELPATEMTKKSKKKKKDDAISKYRALLLEIDEKEAKQKKDKYEMEFTWDVAADAAAAAAVMAAKDDKDVAGKSNAQLTPIERVLQKRNEKNKKRKEEQRRKKLHAQGIDPDKVSGDDSDSDFMPDGIDMNDPYFAEEFANGEFAAQKTAKGTKKQTKRKSNVKNNGDDDGDGESERQAKELELLLDDDDEADGFKQHFNLEQIQKNEQQTKSKRKRQKQLKKSKANIADGRQPVEDNFQINLNDDRFGAVYTMPQFNIDPTDSHYKKTKGMEQIIHEKLKRRHNADRNGQQQRQQAQAHDATNDDAAVKRPRKQMEQQLLVKSLKRKLQKT